MKSDEQSCQQSPGSADLTQTRVTHGDTPNLGSDSVRSSTDVPQNDVSTVSVSLLRNRKYTLNTCFAERH